MPNFSIFLYVYVIITFAYFLTDLPKDGPEITGEEIQYQIGDVLNLNCTSGKAHPAPLVEWLINDESVCFK